MLHSLPVCGEYDAPDLLWAHTSARVFDRKHELMTALQKALPVGVVRYGCGVKAVDEIGGKGGLGVKVSLDGGDVVEGKVLVVADGLFSRYEFTPPQAFPI
jgi:hypothetical protein